MTERLLEGWELKFDLSDREEGIAIYKDGQNESCTFRGY